MERVAEPELMLDSEQVLAYAQANFEEPHSHFMELLQNRLGGLPASGLALDLGCGPGDISRRFAEAFPGWRVDGIDGSTAMLDQARAMTPPNAPIRYRLMHLPAHAPDRYDLMFSNSLLHHLDDPAVLWSTLREWAIERRPCPVFVMDLLRPADPATAAGLVEQYAAGEPAVLREDFLHSLRAAYEVEEIDEQIRRAGLALRIEVVSDRHVIAWGHVE